MLPDSIKQLKRKRKRLSSLIIFMLLIPTFIGCGILKRETISNNSSQTTTEQVAKVENIPSKIDSKPIEAKKDSQVAKVITDDKKVNKSVTEEPTVTKKTQTEIIKNTQKAKRIQTEIKKKPSETDTIQVEIKKEAADIKTIQKETIKKSPKRNKVNINLSDAYLLKPIADKNSTYKGTGYVFYGDLSKDGIWNHRYLNNSSSGQSDKKPTPGDTVVVNDKVPVKVREGWFKSSPIGYLKPGESLKIIEVSELGMRKVWVKFEK